MSKNKKWAQLSKLERVSIKLGYKDFLKVQRKGLSKTEARERNKYYQLLGHWSKLYEASKTANS